MTGERDEALSERLGMDVILDPSMPRNTAMIVPAGGRGRLFFDYATPVWRPDPWGPASYPEPFGKHERRRALDFLARLLDDWCEEVGATPDLWRKPRAEALWRRNMHAIVAEERIALSINNPRTVGRIVP